jgi:drug/metabolite transporter (DMT)-like permease
MKQSSKNYKGIYFMLLAALGFSVMGGFAKMLKYSFTTPELVFYRNLVGFVFLAVLLLRFPVKQSGGKLSLLLFRGIMGTLALYTLLYNIIHIPLGAAMTYNTINTFYIALLSWWFLKEKLNTIAWICIVTGFAGILLIYKPSVDFSWKYHFVGLLHGLFSALAYLSIGTLNKYYDTRIIVLSFLLSGLLLPLLGMLTGYVFGFTPDDFFFPVFHWPRGVQWIYLLGLGVSALLGQYFVTKAYSNDKAGIVSAIGYSNIVFGLVIGIILGDALPDWLAIIGVIIVIVSGVLISLMKEKN